MLNFEFDSALKRISNEKAYKVRKAVKGCFGDSILDDFGAFTSLLAFKNSNNDVIVVNGIPYPITLYCTIDGTTMQEIVNTGFFVFSGLYSNVAERKSEVRFFDKKFDESKIKLMTPSEYNNVLKFISDYTGWGWNLVPISKENVIFNEIGYLFKATEEKSDGVKDIYVKMSNSMKYPLEYTVFFQIANSTLARFGFIESDDVEAEMDEFYKAGMN